jgi:hypothetical protein
MNIEVINSDTCPTVAPGAEYPPRWRPLVVVPPGLPLCHSATGELHVKPHVENISSFYCHVYKYIEMPLLKLFTSNQYQ